MRIDDKVSELMMLELATESIKPEVYQYRTEWGIPVVYYIFDSRKLDEGIYEPIYFTTDDVSRLNQSEDALFQKTLENTVFLMRSQIIPFSQYLKEFIPGETDYVRLMIMNRVIEQIEGLEDRKKLWCATSIIRKRGACCCFFKALLRAFCYAVQSSRLFIGINNNDYALLIGEETCKPGAIQKLIYKTGHVLEGQEILLQKGVLVYEYESDTLMNYEKIDDTDIEIGGKIE